MSHPPLLFGGLRITQLAVAPQWPEGKILPDRIPSLSPCRAGFVPVGLLDPRASVREQAAQWVREASEKWQLAPAELEQIVALGEQQAREIPGLHWPSSISSLEAARVLLGILPPDHDWRVLGVGAEPATAAALCAAHAQEPALDGSVASLLRAGAPVPSGGHCLGFELLCYDFEFSFGCSGFCCGVEKLVYQHMGVRPNAHGLIESADDARVAAQRTTDEGWGEPLKHWPIALIDYTEAVRLSPPAAPQ